ncbi:MAG: Hsp70 family protein [Streptosporangiales bacterium]|nr:Hsp70 family protein [Streptosporangiales bacterium]
MARALGIDLGTTYSAVAVVRDDGRPEILRSREGDNITPSVVLFTGDQVLVGSTASRTAVTMPDESVRFVKRFMGDPHWSFVDAAGTQYRPEEVSAFILRRLADDAEMMLGTRVDDVVITVPAYFDDARRTATLDAAEIAGLRALRLINEPTAAAVAYGLDEIDRGVCLVYDLGGGTFDVTLMDIAGGRFDVLGTDGDRNLGGFDFDNELMLHVNREITAAGGPDLFDGGAIESDLREKCELAKRTLTNVPQASVFMAADGRSHRVQVSRDAFERLTRPLLDRTETILESVLEAADTSWDRIDHVLLVGGSTRMPMVRSLLERLSGRPPESHLNPDEVVAFGAAIVADLAAAEHYDAPAATPAIGQVDIRDVTSQSIGVIAVDDVTDKPINAPIIPKNSTIPCQYEDTFVTLVDGQTEWFVEITEGDDPDPDYVVKLVSRPVELPAGLPKGAPMKVTMSYDADGVVHVVVTDGTSGRSLGEIELERPLNIARDDIEQMRSAMARLEIQ